MQHAAQTGLVAADGARLHYWDTGGSGPAIVLLHPATGSDRIWLYQQPAFAAAGYRVIAYSRRGHAGSDPVVAEHPGTAAGDLYALVRHLGLTRFHLLGSAAGGGIALDYTLSHPEFASSLVLACAVGGIVEREYVTRATRLRVTGFDALPAYFRELSPSYRAANPEGTQDWALLEEGAVTGNREGQQPENRIDWAALARIKTPTLVIGGDADLSAPPALLRAYASHIPGAEVIIVPDAGHSLYWEAPELFNAAVLRFWARARGR
jgi:pimeloyl-ACP methyl ester carboxylesterase